MHETNQELKHVTFLTSRKFENARKRKSVINYVLTNRNIYPFQMLDEIVFMCFVDITQAFDEVRLKDIVGLLKQISVDSVGSKKLGKHVRQANLHIVKIIQRDSGEIKRKKCPITAKIAKTEKHNKKLPRWQSKR